MSIKIRTVTPSNPDLHLLIERLDAYLATIYPPEEIFTLDFQSPAVAETTFAIAYADETPAGCGAIRPIADDAVELKRFYVDTPFRNQGVAARILSHLERIALERGYPVLRLETGIHQLEAIAFYRKHGYHEIAPYGEYAGCPSSVCFEKKLESPAAYTYTP